MLVRLHSQEFKSWTYLATHLCGHVCVCECMFECVGLALFMHASKMLSVKHRGSEKGKSEKELVLRGPGFSGCG